MGSTKDTDIGALSAKLCEVLARLHEAEAEVARLQRIIDGRPAINAGLPESYISWSQGIYELEAARALGIQN